MGNRNGHHLETDDSIWVTLCVAHGYELAGKPDCAERQEELAITLGATPETIGRYFFATALELARVSSGSTSKRFCERIGNLYNQAVDELADERPWFIGELTRSLTIELQEAALEGDRAALLRDTDVFARVSEWAERLPVHLLNKVLTKRPDLSTFNIVMALPVIRQVSVSAA